MILTKASKTVPLNSRTFKILNSVSNLKCCPPSRVHTLDNFLTEPVYIFARQPNPKQGFYPSPSTAADVHDIVTPHPSIITGDGGIQNQQQQFALLWEGVTHQGDDSQLCVSH